MDLDPSKIRLDPMRRISKHDRKMAIRKGITDDELKRYMQAASRCDTLLHGDLLYSGSCCPVRENEADP